MLKIGVVGLGLIGGSIEQRLKAYPDKYEILSVSESQQREYKLEDLAEADIVFLCGPQSQIIKYLERIAKIVLASGKESTVPETERAFAKTIITDVASTKMPVCNKAQELGLKNFIGGHPMAGTEKQGFDSSFPQLFEGAKWILTETNSSTQDLEKLIREDFGSSLVIMDPDTHDKSVALVSHLPLVLSLAICRLLWIWNGTTPSGKNWASVA